MKTILVATFALFLLVARQPVSAQGAQTPGINPGDNLPSKDAVMRNATGSPVSMKGAAAENGLLVMFSCNTCPFVVRNQAVTRKTLAYAKEHHIGVVILNSNEAQRGDADSYEAMQRYAKEQGYTVPYLVDQDARLADQFGANHTPEIYLFDKSLKLVYKGAMNDNPGDPKDAKQPFIEDAINALVAGKPIDPNTTRSVGCSIKRRA